MKPPRVLNFSGLTLAEKQKVVTAIVAHGLKRIVAKRRRSLQPIAVKFVWQQLKNGAKTVPQYRIQKLDKQKIVPPVTPDVIPTAPPV